jgi:hypothetical protein
MEVAELAPGLWRWTARHPEWTPDQGGPEGWEPEVASYYCEAAGDVLLIDPIVPADGGERERFWRALDHDVEKPGALHVVLTCAWHARSSGAVLVRYRGARLWTHADDLDELPAGVVATNPFRPGDALPGGASAIAAAVGGPVTDVLLWLPSHAALVSGDTLLGGGPAGVRVCPDSWLGGADPAEVRAGLRTRLGALPVERVLVTHGEPLLANGRSALERELGR